MNDNANVFQKLMENENLNDLVIDTFIRYYSKYIKGEKGKLSANDIEIPDSDSVLIYSQLSKINPQAYNKVAVLKLNGGLGTSMGLKKAKSLLPVKGDLTFLDIIVNQILSLRKKTHCDIPLILMNSFNTQNDTLNYLKKYSDLTIKNLPIDFVQNKFPKIRQDNFMPLDHKNVDSNWNPPGHGDLYTCLTQEGLIDKLLSQGKEILFVSNSDNLGAVLDEKILTLMLSKEIPFIMEVCARTEMDKKGGHLAKLKNGRLVLRELAQCPEDEIHQFQNIETFKFFNTNNLWINLKSLKDYMNQNNNLIDLPLIVNPKTVDGTNVVQLETAMGSAISLFNGAKAVLVGRDRFIPVKKTQDMLVVWSDVYELTPDYTLFTNRDELPIVELDPRYYETIDQLAFHCNQIPSLKNCQYLSVTGNFTFNENVSFNGKVTLKSEKSIHLNDISISSS